ncbi:MAG: diguanylate cyclase [Actinobacteria bacterium]|nr:diguanylate cyclase [Actinomycetota bacterium]
MNIQLEAIENLYQIIMHRTGDAVLCLDTGDGHVLHANKWAEKLTGLSAGDCVVSPEPSVNLALPGWLRDAVSEARNRKVVRTCAIWESPEFGSGKNRLLEIFITRMNSGESRLAILVRTLNSDRMVEKKLWRRNHELHLLNHASRMVSRSLNPREVASIALELSLDLFDARCGIGYLADPEKSALVPVAAHGVSETLDLRELGFGGGQPPVTAFNAGDTVFCTGRLPDGQLINEEGLSTVTIPLQTNNAVLGVLELAGDSDESPGMDYNADLFTSFGFQVGIALENALLHKKVEDASRLDGLTGIHTRRYVETLLEDCLKRGKRYGEKFATLMIDIDRFKPINDFHGHEIGDQVLKQVVEVFRQEVRDTDYLGRWGGEEFLIILTQVGWQEALNIAERIRLRVAALSFMKISGSELPITVCVGVACYPDHSDSADSLVRCADDAMRYAKRKGRNRTHLFREDAVGVTEEDIRQEIDWGAGMETIRALAAALDAKDSYTASHSESVKMLSVKIAVQMQLDTQQSEVLEWAGLLHDIGKVAIPDSILNKPGSLEPDEWAIIREHPRMGVLILKEAPQLSSIIPVVLHHHENFDGSGYPMKIAGEDIPLLARILRVADAFMAMTSNRPYRKSLSTQEAWFEIESASGRLFDPLIVSALAGIVAS